MTQTPLRLFIAAALSALMGLPAAAHDIPRVKAPGTTVVVQQPLWPEFGRQAGEGRVRLVFHSADLAVRMSANEFHAFEQAYARRLTRLMMRMSFEAADPIARHGAWHEIVGRTPVPEFRTEAAPQ